MKNTIGGNLMTPAVIAKIISMQQNFTVSENEIAQYVMNHTDSIITSTISAIAKETGTSEASINRFCKKLGLKGFNSLKIALAQESFYNKMNNPSQSSRNGNILSSVSQDYQRILLNTTAMLEENALQQIVETLKKAEFVYIFGLSETAFVTQEFASKLSLVGIRAKSITDITEISIEASHIRKNDFAIFIVSSVLSRGLMPSINMCRDRGAKLLAITSYDSPQLNEIMDYKLVTSDTITARNSVSISNNLIFLYVVDVVYTILLGSDKSLRDKKLNSDVTRNHNQTLDNFMYYP